MTYATRNNDSCLQGRRRCESSTNIFQTRQPTAGSAYYAKNVSPTHLGIDPLAWLVVESLFRGEIMVGTDLGSWELKSVPSAFAAGSRPAAQRFNRNLQVISVTL